MARRGAARHCWRANPWPPSPPAAIARKKGADLFLEAMARWCKHGQLRWLGGLTERHLGYDTIFMDGEKDGPRPAPLPRRS